MKIEFDPDFLDKLKKKDVRIRNHFKNKILLFSKNPNNTELNNHPLKRDWDGYRSINVTAYYRAIYKEVKLGDEIVAYFITIGSHKELYNS